MRARALSATILMFFLFLLFFGLLVCWFCWLFLGLLFLLCLFFLFGRVTVHAGCHIGARGIIHSGAVIGADGFGFANENGNWIKIPQTGRVVIGDDVEIGANTTIDRGALSV